MLTVPFRTLQRDVHIHCPDRRTADELAFMRCSPDIEGPAPDRMDLHIEPCHGFLRLRTPAGVVMEGSAAVLIDQLHRLRFQMVRAERPEALLICGGALTFDAGHILFIGDPGCGQTTLLAYLADLGWPAAGDQQLIAEGQAATPFPNTLRVRSGTLPHLSARGADIVCASPRIAGWFDNPTYAVDPSAFGIPWTLRSLPLRHVVIVQANHGGGSRLKPIDRTLVMEAICRDLLLPDLGRARALSNLNSMVSSAGGWELRVGRLDEARRLLQELPGLDH